MSTSPTARRGYSGKTQNTLDNSAMLGAEFWHEGQEVLCLYNREFATKYGAGHEFLLVSPKQLMVAIDQYGHASPADVATNHAAKSITRFAMPPLAGFDMAYQDLVANGFDTFRHGDRVVIRCVGIQKSTNREFSDMPMFELSVDAR
jgi:hypothetical protein